MCFVTSHLYSTALMSAFREALCLFVELMLVGISTFGPRKPRRVHSRLMRRLPIRNLRSSEDSRRPLCRKVRGGFLLAPLLSVIPLPTNQMNFGLEFIRCTALHGVPTHFLGVLSELKSRRNSGEVIGLSRLRTGIASGSPVPIDLMKQLIDQMNLTELTVAYGMS